MIPSSVGLSATRFCRANKAERIEVCLGWGSKGHCIGLGPDFPHGFDAAFAKLLWPLILYTSLFNVKLYHKWFHQKQTLDVLSISCL